jgi:hypothetical protein
LIDGGQLTAALELLRLNADDEPDTDVRVITLDIGDDVLRTLVTMDGPASRPYPQPTQPAWLPSPA